MTAKPPNLHVGLSAGMIQGGKTGVAQYVFSLVRALLARPDAPRLTLFVLENDAPLFDFVDRGAARIELVPEQFRPALRNLVWHQAVLPSLVRRLGLQVLHVPSYRRLLWSRPCALVGTVHDLAPFHVRAKYDPARMFYGRVVVRRLVQRQDQVIAVSQSTACDLQRYFHFPAERLRVIHNGLDHDRFNPGDPVAARAECRKRWQLDRPFFLYVSRLEHPGKNHVRMLEAFSRFKTTTRSDWLLAFGGSDWHGAEAIHAAAAASPCRGDVRFLGYVPDPDLPILYRAAGAVVYPSLFEGFGFPPVEAMACDCPVLSSARGALAEVVADAAAIVDPESVDEIQAGLSRLATDGSWREKLRAAGLRNARRFSWSTNAEQVLQCYRDAITRR